MTITDVIILIAENFEKSFIPVFCNITKYDYVKFHVKSIFLSGFTQRVYYVPDRDMIRQKYPGADRVKQLYVFALNQAKSSFINPITFLFFLLGNGLSK